MIGKIIAAVAGAKAAKQPGGVSEPTGALLGIGTLMLVRRFGLPGMVAAAAGGWALKRYKEKRSGEKRRKPARATA